MRRSAHGAVALALAAVLAPGAPAAQAQPPTAAAAHGAMELPDLQTLAALRRAGADLGKPHTPVYYLHFPDESAAKAARRAATEEGFGVIKTMPARDRQQWVLILTRTMTLSLDNVRNASASLRAIATRHGGVYDGWQAEARR